MFTISPNSFSTSHKKKNPFKNWSSTRRKLYQQLHLILEIESNKNVERKLFPNWLYELPFKSQAAQHAFVEEAISIVQDSAIPLRFWNPQYLYNWYEKIEQRNDSGAFTMTTLHHELATYLQYYGTTKRKYPKTPGWKSRKKIDKERYELLLSVPMQLVIELKRICYSKMNYWYIEDDLLSLTLEQQVQLPKLIHLAYEKQELLYLYIGAPLLKKMKGNAFGEKLTRFIQEILPLIIDKVNPSEYDMKYTVKTWFILWVQHQYPSYCSLKEFREISQIATVPFVQIIAYLPYGLLKDIIYFDDANLFIHLGGGNSIRTLKPYHLLTKKMAHEFKSFRSLEKRSCRFTLSYLLSLGCSLPLAQVIERQIRWRINKFSTEKMQHLQKWKLVILKCIQWFPSLTEAQEQILIAILGYIKHCQEEGIEFSVKGRTLASMRRIVAEWQAAIKHRSHGKTTSWKGANYQPWQEVKKEGEYCIVQLTDSLQLYQEGVYLRHCISTYVAKCKHHKTTIWSLRLRLEENEWLPLVTIEINKIGQILQARGRYNALPSNAYQEIIEAWAKQEQLQILKY